MTWPSYAESRRPQTLLLLIGIVSGLAFQLNWLADKPVILFNNFTILLRLPVGVVVFLVLLLSLRELLWKIIRRSSLPARVKDRYLRHDTLTYTVLLLPVLGSIGIQFTAPAFGALMVLAFLAAQSFLIYSLMDKERKQEVLSSSGWLSFLFLISGFAALIYQIVWQRSLFTAFGVNIESITVIVSIFMFGLGIGALVGGVLSRKFPSRLPYLFLAFEVIIGVFGIVSLPLIKVVSGIAVHDSILKIALAAFGLLCIPTIFMGATLPILVTYLHRHYRNIGQSVGILYFINTAGSAIACLITADILFGLFGKQMAVTVAAFCNFVVGFLVYQYTRKIRETPADRSSRETNPECDITRAGKTGARVVRFGLILLLSCMTGYISLSQEIIWFRAISYTTGGDPNVFSYVLGIFLLGIAFGALCAKKVCEMKKNYTMIFIASMLAFSSIAYYLSIPFIGLLLTVSKQFGMCAAYLSVGILSFLVGGIFPVLCHYGVRSSNAVGLSVSWIYFANILGSTTGPLLTGFVLMNAFPLQQNILYLSVATLALSALVWLAAPIANPLKAAMGGAVAMGIVGMLIFHAGLYSQILEKLHFQTHFAKDSAYKYVIQNRSGIIAVEAGKNDTLYGGGVYDGRFNINPVLDSNGITRAYMVAALHPQPEEVLDIGLGSGSWARVIANHAGVKSLTVVEINPGYLKAIKNYPEIATILNDPKIDIHTDDGRRWLNRNPDRKFDFIVMNTTMHWRDGATNLLSEEFLRLCKQHLKAGGVIYYNATASKDVPFTASQVFRHVTMVGSFVAASDSPFALSEKEKRQNLLKFLDSGRPLFTENSNLQRVLTNLARNDISDKADVIRANERLWHITDDNMATEFKATNRWFKARATWVNLLKRLMAMKSLFSISESY